MPQGSAIAPFWVGKRLLIDASENFNKYFKIICLFGFSELALNMLLLNRTLLTMCLPLSLLVVIKALALKPISSSQVKAPFLCLNGYLLT